MKNRTNGSYWRVLLPLLLLILAVVAIAAERILPDLKGPEPSIAWEEASPASEGFDGAAFEALADRLAARNTKALIIARHGKLVFEWYAPDFTVNRRHFTAAMAKGVSAMPTLIAAAQDGLLSLSDHVADWVPEWKEDPRHAKITLLDLAFHRSGIADVDFHAGHAGELQGWKKRYYNHPDERFRLALDRAPLLFDAGERFSYSGVGYYVLSYVVTRALQKRTPIADIPSFLGAEVYGPLGLPHESWSLGYGRSDMVDGMALTHFASGGEITARAAARIGQLMLQHGCWAGRQLLDADLVDLMLGRGAVTPMVDEAFPNKKPMSLGGWWSNENGAWPSVPRAAFAAIGDGHQITFVDPVNQIVVVRMGSDLRKKGEMEGPAEAAFDRFLLAPVYAAFKEAGGGAKSVATSPRERLAEGRACAE